MMDKKYTFYEESFGAPLGEFSTDSYSEAENEAIRLANIHGVEVSINLGDESLDFHKPDGHPWRNDIY